MVCTIHQPASRLYQARLPCVACLGRCALLHPPCCKAAALPSRLTPCSGAPQMLDKLLLLSKGHMMYYGEAQAVAEWFQRLGYAMPYGVNSADFILDMASGDVYTKKLDGEESRKHCIECSEHYLQHRPCGYLQGGDLSEELLGSQLWSAAEVLPSCASYSVVSPCLQASAGPGTATPESLDCPPVARGLSCRLSSSRLQPGCGWRCGM